MTGSVYEGARIRIDDIDRIAEAQLQPYMWFEETPRLVKLTLIASLWMVLCRRANTSLRSFDMLFAAFDDFIFSRTGIFSGSLRQIAMFYFAGGLDRWIKVQRNSSAERAFGELTNSAMERLPSDFPTREILHSLTSYHDTAYGVAMPILSLRWAGDTPLGRAIENMQSVAAGTHYAAVVATKNQQ